MSDKPMLCKFHVHVECNRKDDCKKCGWNPLVEADRIAEIRKNPPVRRPSKRAIFTRWWK